MGDLSVQSESASRPGLPSSIAWWYFAVGSALAILSIAVPSATLRTASYLAVIVTLVPAAVIGARRNRASGAVWKFAAAMAVFFLITEVAASLRTPDRSMLGAHLFEDVARTAGQLLYVGVLVAIVRVRRGRNVGSMLADATIVACGAWIVCYVTLIDPTLERSTQPALNTFIQGLYQPIGVAVVFMLAVVIFAETFRPVSMWFLATAILGALLGDLGYALEAAGHIGDGWLVVADSGYIIAYVSAGAMFLHPSVRSLTEPIPVGHLRPSTNRMLITTASLILPVAVLVVSEARTNVDAMVRLVSGVALCVAVIVRVASAISANDRAQRALLLTAQHDPLTGLPNRALLGEQITAGAPRRLARGRAARPCSSSTSTGSRTSTTASGTPWATRCCGCSVAGCAPRSPRTCASAASPATSSWRWTQPSGRWARPLPLPISCCRSSTSRSTSARATCTSPPASAWPSPRRTAP